MRFRWIAILWLVLGLALLSACATALPQANSLTPSPETAAPATDEPAGTPVDTGTPEGTETPDETQEAQVIPEFLIPARDRLAEELGIPEDQIVLQSYEAVEWRNSCLGVSQPGEMCLMVITPGYRVLFSTPQGTFQVNMDESGSSVRIAPGVEETGSLLEKIRRPAVIWRRSGGFAGVCQGMGIGLDGSYLLEDCSPSGEVIAGELPAGALEKLNQFLDQYAAFEWESETIEGAADMFADSYSFYGRGSEQPSPEEQVAINEFLASVYNELFLDAADRADQDGAGESGVSGQVLIGPACPGPVSVESPCPDEPYQATLTILNEAGQIVTQVQTDAQGQFKVNLEPGAYVIRPESSGAFPQAAEQTITVGTDEFTEVQITYDSGIR